MGDTPQVAEPTVLYCANHPTVETLLRCSKCGKPICPRCGIRTPVGLRCRPCAQMRRPRSYVVGPGHYLLATLVALPASFLAGFIMERVGFFFAFFLGAGVGGLIAEIVYRVTGGKRGKGLALVVCGCIVAGALASGLAAAFLFSEVPLAMLADPKLALSLLYRLNIIYVVLAVGAAFARLN